MTPPRFRLVPRRSTFLHGAQVILDAVVENPGAEPVALPHPTIPSNPLPTYVLEGPEGPAPFTPRELFKDTGPADLELLHLDGGETWEGDLPLGRLAPGSYRVSASFEWRGSRIEAEPAAFAVVAASYRGATLALGADAPGRFFSIVEVVQANPEAPAVAGLVVHKQPLGEGLEAGGPEVWGALPPDTARLLPFAASYGLITNPMVWFGALTPGGLHLGNNLADGTCRVPAARPLLGTGTLLGFADRSVLVVSVLGGEAAALATVAVPPTADPIERPFVEGPSLEGGFVDLATAHGPRGGPAALVATTGAVAEGTRLRVWRLDRAGRASEPLTLDLPERPEPGLAILARSDGKLTILAVTRDLERPGTRTISVIEGPLEGPLVRKATVPVEGLALLPEPLRPVETHVLVVERAPGRADAAVLFVPRDELPPVRWMLAEGVGSPGATIRPDAHRLLFPDREGFHVAQADADGRCAVAPL